MGKKSQVVIIILWILVILSLLTVSVGHRVSMALRLSRYQKDRLRAYGLAKAGINRLIAEKQRDEDPLVDTLNESWSNRQEGGKPIYNEFLLGDGVFTVNYIFRESKNDIEGTPLYGMMDEQSKFNINSIIEEQKQKQFIELLKLTITEGNQEKAEYLANALADWIDTDDTSKLSGGSDGSEKSDYVDLGYSPKNNPLSVIEEILLVKGFTPDILYGEDKNNDGILDSTEEGLINYITIYEYGEININTTTKEVLQALINAEPQDPSYKYQNLASEIFLKINREGNDKIFGTPDDNAINNISEITNEFSDDVGKQGIINSLAPYLSFSSNTFRIKSVGMVNNTRKEIVAVVWFKVGNQPTFVSRHEN